MAKGLTFQYLAQLSVLLLIIIICPGGTLYAELHGSDLTEPTPHLVL
jgi:hypothetical protein